MLNGKPLAPTPANIKYAMRVDFEIKQKIKLGVYRESDYFPTSGRIKTHGVPTVGQYFDLWMQGRTDAAASTLAKDKLKIAGFWLPELGSETPLMAVVKSTVLNALARRPEWSGKTRNNTMSLLRGALQLAVDDGVIDTNPCDLIKASKHQDPEPDPFTLDELEKICAFAKAHQPEPIYNYVEFGFWSGLRTNELMGLEWGTVELGANRVSVTHGVVDGKETAQTKTARGRVVDLNTRSHAALERQQKHSKLMGGRVFTHPAKGIPWEHDLQFRVKYWKPMLLRVGVRYRSPYEMRHTYATTGLLAGNDPGYMAAQLGHALQVFYTRYVKWIASQGNTANLNRMNQFISQPKDNYGFN
jgi:integrase